MRCPQCGRENGSHLKFCLACGTELSGTAPPAADAPPAWSSTRTEAVCPACGAKAKPEWKFCLGCGKALPPAGPPVLYPPEPGPPPAPPGETRPPPRSAGDTLLRLDFKVRLVTGLIAVAGLFVFLICIRSGGSGPTAPSSSTSAEAPGDAGDGPFATPVDDPPRIVAQELQATARKLLHTCPKKVPFRAGTAWRNIEFEAAVGYDGRLSVSVVQSGPNLAGSPMEECLRSGLEQTDAAAKLGLTGPFTVRLSVEFQAF